MRKANGIMRINDNINKSHIHHNLLEKIFVKGINDAQIAGIDAILDEWIASGLNDMRHLAYILATAYHETDKTMQPIEEYGKGRGKKYGNKIKYDGTDYTYPNKIFYGRGHVQLTWYENYEKFGKLLHLPLLYYPEFMLDNNISARVLILGMTRGLFTGKKLSDYFNNKVSNPVQARRTVNGLDRADMIANLYDRFLDCVIIQ